MKKVTKVKEVVNVPVKVKRKKVEKRYYCKEEMTFKMVPGVVDSCNCITEYLSASLQEGTSEECSLTAERGKENL